MRLNALTIKQWGLLVVVILLATLSLTTAALLRFPAFYESDLSQKSWTFLSTGLFFLTMVVFASMFLILPRIDAILKKKNLLFLIPMIILLMLILSSTSANYWAVPEIHNMAICFDADDGKSSIDIEEIVDPNTNRLFSPNSFGFSRYPIRVASGDCLDGSILVLISPLTQALIGYHVTAAVEETPPDGRLAIDINNTPSMVSFEQSTQSQENTHIVLKDGFENGTKLEEPWGQMWLLGFKLIAPALSAAFIALFLSALIEEVFSYTVKNNGRLHGKASKS